MTANMIYTGWNRTLQKLVNASDEDTVSKLTHRRDNGW